MYYNYELVKFSLVTTTFPIYKTRLGLIYDTAYWSWMFKCHNIICFSHNFVTESTVSGKLNFGAKQGLHQFMLLIVYTIFSKKISLHGLTYRHRESDIWTSFVSVGMAGLKRVNLQTAYFARLFVRYVVYHNAKTLPNISSKLESSEICSMSRLGEDIGMH